MPWRGRITLSRGAGAAGLAGQDGGGGGGGRGVLRARRERGGLRRRRTERSRYAGPAEWSYRRFILHYAHLCALAGGVDAFCIGSEMRELTQIRDGADGYPAVRALLRAGGGRARRSSAPATKIGYAADWSEYFGHQPADGSGDVLFHLDPLWAHPAIDFVGIDNYMPLSDWRDGAGHADAAAGLDLRPRLSRGERRAAARGSTGTMPTRRGARRRTRLPITDGAYGEAWVFRYKDLVSWWSQPHFDRPGGVKAAAPTAWLPRSKPIWFTELGCPAVDKGTNQPNVFSRSEVVGELLSRTTRAGRGTSSSSIATCRRCFAHWGDPANNPVSDVYGGRMVDMARAHVWAWDARPWPDFPDRLETWADGDELRPRALAERADEPRGAGGRGGRDLRALRADGRSMSAGCTAA